MNIIKKPFTVLEGIKTIAILGDPGCSKSWEKNFPRLLRKVWEDHSPQLFIVAGDLSYRARIREYKRILYYMNSVPATWVAVPGDHDRPFINFYRYFGALRKVIDVSQWRFIGINTGNRNFKKKDAHWIQKNIRENSIIFSHIPPEIDDWSFHSLKTKPSNYFLEVIKKNRNELKKMFFGHIHGYSEQTFLDIPMIVTGGVAQSKVIRDNQYNDQDYYAMTIFDVKTGHTSFCTIE
ncbi:MAG: metallophosphoesterase [Spirochaetota bacterium]|nr:metallophosphoesterase [Spirochaetota bacterium]